MAVKLAKRTGFCFGVKRAITMAEGALKTNKDISSLGPVIHNRQVVGRLSKKGLKVIKNIDEIKGIALVISSHGLSPKIMDAILARGVKIVDTTCPFVLNAQRIAKSLSEEGYDVVIIGDINHPEIKALMDFVSTKAIAVKDKREAKKLKLNDKSRIGIISQTTQSTVNFLEAVKTIVEKMPKEMRIFNTICNDAEDRQTIARQLAKSVDLMLVVGGRHSANTRRLLEVCKQVLKNCHLIETEDEIKKSWFKKGQSVGITSGASTPDWIVKRVVDRIKKKGCVIDG